MNEKFKIAVSLFAIFIIMISIGTLFNKSETKKSQKNEVVEKFNEESNSEIEEIQSNSNHSNTNLSNSNEVDSNYPSSNSNFSNSNTSDSKKSNSNINSSKVSNSNVSNSKVSNSNVSNSKASNSNISNPNITNSKTDIFSKYYDRANEILSTMTLDEKVGQMFFVRYPYGDANKEIVSENPGGYILFAKDFENESKASFINKISQNQKNSKIKMLIGVDEEGGSVVRVSKFTQFRTSPFQSPQTLYNKGGMDLVLSDASEKANLLLSLGINTNLAPVVDIPTNKNSFIYARSFGTDYKLTSDFAKEIITLMNSKKIISSMKHFPGYGDNVDTHTGIAIDTRSYNNFKERDFQPFIAGIKAGSPMIMVNHNIVNSMDKKYPASLSKNVHDILRKDLNFSGLIITDDLAMGAISSYATDGTAAVQAVLAGNDMLISSDFEKQKKEVLTAIKNKKISEETINNAVRRILACKLYYGIIK